MTALTNDKTTSDRCDEIWGQEGRSAHLPPDASSGKLCTEVADAAVEAE
jgi:hypothetical protein